MEQEFRSAAVNLCAERGGEFLAQGESTVAIPCFTREEFVLGGTNWRAETAERTPTTSDDDKHMNDRYGAIMLRKILQRLDELSGGAVIQSEQAHRSIAAE